MVFSSFFVKFQGSLLYKNSEEGINMKFAMSVKGMEKGHQKLAATLCYM